MQGGGGEGGGWGGGGGRGVKGDERTHLQTKLEAVVLFIFIILACLGPLLSGTQVQ